MENYIPTYLTKDFLKRTLENGLETSDIQIENFSVSPVSDKGENYTSEIIRVCVNYKGFEQKDQKISLIVKNIFTSEGERFPEKARDSLEKVDIIQIEIDMYTNIIPEIEKLLGNVSMLAPKCLNGSREAQLLVLADLNAMGYELQNRIVGLDEAHCKVVMQKIAQLHAGSMRIIKENPNYVHMFSKPLFNEVNVNSNTFSQIFTSNFEQMINVARSWPEYEKIVEKLEKICTNLMKKGYETCKQKAEDLKVINHDDLWVNNMMFKYNNDNKTPSDVAFIDLQVAYYGGLGIDINYFFNTSLQFEVLKSKREELLKIYYKTLKSTLEQLKYSPIPSWEEVKTEVRSKEIYGLVILGCVFPIIIMDKSASKNSSFETILESSEEKTNAMFGSDRMKDTLRYSLKRFDELGVLDE